MKRNYTIILILSLLTITLSAQNKRGYKSLEKGEFDKAKESFAKTLETDSLNVAANFGYAIVLGDDKSPFFDIVEAYRYVSKMKGRENELVQEDIDIIGEYFSNTETRKTNRPVKKKVEIAVEALDARLIKYIREENNLDAVYRVLALFPNYKHYDNVVHIRNQFEFRKYEKINTLAAYEEFLDKFPEAAQAEKARKHIYLIALDDAKVKNTEEAFNRYISRYPESAYVQVAIKLRNAIAYTTAQQKNTLEAYQSFIEKYPDALEIPEARKHQHQLMYEMAKRVKTLQAYNEFIRNYPDGAYYLDIFNLKASDLGMQEFRKLNFNTPDFLWARALDYNQTKENAAALAETKDGGIIITGSMKPADTAFTDAWIIKLDAQGKMIWNKTIGQPFDDKVLDVMVTSDNNVIVVGYTNVTVDTASAAAWMFKLSGDGKKLWNKNLGNIHIKACTIGPNDKIYLATYIVDTVPDHYYLQAYSAEEGRQVWERDYSGLGTFNDIAFTPDEKVLLAGSKWVAFADPKFYLKWDDMLKNGSTAKVCALGQQNIVVAATDSLNQSLLSYSLTGSKLWQLNESIPDNSYQLNDVVITPKNEILVLNNTLTGSSLNKYSNNGTGAAIANKQISGNYKFIKAIKTSRGEIVYLLSGDDYLVLTFSSAGF